MSLAGFRTRSLIRLNGLALGLVLPMLVATIWQLAAATNRIDSSLWASPVLVAQALAAQIEDPQFWSDLGASLLRGAAGTSIGLLIGISAGLALGMLRLMREMFAPVLDAGKAVPIFTWVPLLSVWLGSGEAGKISFIALAAMLPVLFSTIEGVFSLDTGYRELARLLQLNPLVRLRRVVVPGALPAILRGVHLALLYGWLATIGAEYFFEAGNGIGTNILGAREMFRLDLVVADMIAIGIVGILLDAGMRGVENYLLRWDRGEQT